jgi:hypothetical protein
MSILEEISQNLQQGKAKTVTSPRCLFSSEKSISDWAGPCSCMLGLSGA